MPVYNLEVEGDHVYRVGQSGVLVHNASAPVTITPTPAQNAEFADLAAQRVQLGLVAAGSSNDTHTIAKLIIGGTVIYGINSGTGGRTFSDLKFYNELAKCCNPSGKGAHQEVLKHAEADTIFQAYDKGLTATTAVMYVDRPLCGFCNQSLKNMLCLAGIQTLTWYGPNAARTAYVAITVDAQ